LGITPQREEGWVLRLTSPESAGTWIRETLKDGYKRFFALVNLLFGVTERLKAGWDEDYMLQVLQGITAPVVR